MLQGHFKDKQTRRVGAVKKGDAGAALARSRAKAGLKRRAGGGRKPLKNDQAKRRMRANRSLNGQALQAPLERMARDAQAVGRLALVPTALAQC